MENWLDIQEPATHVARIQINPLCVATAKHIHSRFTHIGGSARAKLVGLSRRQRSRPSWASTAG